ncbi:MAG TPA: AAA family ATPase [Lachnospiraceae bacterium]|nr:AAA family ATPase [Lachnospiraceae bacterium]
MNTNERFISPLLQQDKAAMTFILEKPGKTLDDLVLPDATRQQIGSLLQKVKLHDILYDNFGLGKIDLSGGRTAINLYGPPGTGKSVTAEAIANAMGKPMIRVNYAEIESKFVGETPKNIKEAFRFAKENDAILFFDEADSILGKRLSNVSQSTDHAVNVSRSVMLLELDSFKGVTIFATNFMSNYDGAFVRRIIGHIEMPLPTQQGRMQLYQKMIPTEYPLKITDEELNHIVCSSEGFSGAEILNVIINAATFALNREGIKCRVSLQDFELAIEGVSKAKKANRQI